MNGYWLNADGAYHEGFGFPGDIAVPRKPEGPYVWDGETTSWVPDLPAARALARAVISAAAEAARLHFVTPGSGKAMAYQEKAKEAVEFLADPAAGSAGHDAARYPLVYAEVGATAETVTMVAQIIAGRYQAFKLIEAQIGGMEAAAQKAVKDAASLEEIDAALAGLTWPEPEQE